MDRMTAWLYDLDTTPAEELSEHDQRMIRLGWDAHRTFQPQPDQSRRLLTPEEIVELCDKWEDEYENVEMTDAEWEIKRFSLLVAAQRDLSYPIGFTDGYAKARVAFLEKELTIKDAERKEKVAELNDKWEKAYEKALDENDAKEEI